MAKLVLTAENFAFGPIGKLLNIVDRLKVQGHSLVFAGFGTSLQLAKNYPFDAIHEIDTDNPESNSELEKIIGDNDLLISSMDLASVVVAKRLGKPVVWIDCLFWFWESIFSPLFDIDLFIAERSLKFSANESLFGPKIKNFVTVGPILPTIEKVERKKQALISYGGGEAAMWYKSGKDTNYASVVTNILVKDVDWSHFDRVIVTTNERILKELANQFSNSIFEFTTCGSHDGFLKELAQSEILLTTAGLVTSQEAFESETPVIYLPPSNNSHYILQDELHDLGLARASVHLSDFMPRLTLRGKQENDSIAEVMLQLRELENSPEVQTKIGQKINDLIQTRSTWSQVSVKENKEFLESLGKNGAQTTADKIQQLITTRDL